MPETNFRRTAPFYGLAMASLAVVLILVSLCTCGGDDEREFTYPPVTEKLPDPATTGVITGRAVFVGDAPSRRKLPYQNAWCGSLGKDRYSEDVLVKDGGLANVFIRIESGLDTAWKFDWERDPVTINQEGCVFIPHVAVVRTRQPVQFLNSDRTQHNVNTKNSKTSQKFAKSLAAKGNKWDIQFTRPETGLPVTCDLHSHMRNYLHIVEHPYWALTDATGSFRISGVPAGTYGMLAWHERLGERHFEITVTEKGEVTIPAKELSFKMQ